MPSGRPGARRQKHRLGSARPARARRQQEPRPRSPLAPRLTQPGRPARPERSPRPGPESQERRPPPPKGWWSRAAAGCHGLGAASADRRTPADRSSFALRGRRTGRRVRLRRSAQPIRPRCPHRGLRRARPRSTRGGQASACNPRPSGSTPSFRPSARCLQRRRRPQSVRAPPSRSARRGRPRGAVPPRTDVRGRTRRVAAQARRRATSTPAQPTPAAHRRR